MNIRCCHQLRDVVPWTSVHGRPWNARLDSHLASHTLFLSFSLNQAVLVLRTTNPREKGIVPRTLRLTGGPRLTSRILLSLWLALFVDRDRTRCVSSDAQPRFYGFVLRKDCCCCCTTINPSMPVVQYCCACQAHRRLSYDVIPCA